MRTSRLLILLVWAVSVFFANYLRASEYGKMQRDAIQVNLLNVLNEPQNFAEKRIAVWGVVGGYQEATFLFATHEHARWRDLSSSLHIEPHAELKDLPFGSESWRKLYGQAVRLEGTLRAEKMGEQWSLLLLVQHVFIPEGDRQTAERGKSTEPAR